MRTRLFIPAIALLGLASFRCGGDDATGTSNEEDSDAGGATHIPDGSVSRVDAGHPEPAVDSGTPARDAAAGGGDDAAGSGDDAGSGGGGDDAGGGGEDAGGGGGIDAGSGGGGKDAGSGGAGKDAGSGGGGKDAGSGGGGTDAGSGGGGKDAGSGGGGTDAGSGGATVTFTINVGKGPARQHAPPAAPVAVSPYVYGINSFAAWESTTKWGMVRAGGDAFTPWNWTNNYSNSGADYCYWEGQEDGGGSLAGAITSTGFDIPSAQANGAAFLATTPIVDHVSATFSNNTGINNLCPGSPSCSSGSANGYASNSGNLSFASTNASSPAFVGNAPTKGSTFCTCEPGGACASGCAPSTTGTVYQDEFTNFLKVTYGSGASPVFFSLDNEPNYWPSTHPELWPYTGTPGCGTNGTVSFDDIVTRNSTYAAAIKKAWPATKVFGPVVAQDGIIYAGDYTDPNLPTPFADYYLAKMAAASKTAGTQLLDAFDVHYYTVGSGTQCVQVPRMFWDPNFTTFTAAETDSIDFGWSGQNNYFDTALYPRQMIPRLQGKIATAYGSAASPGLSFSEYNAGCEQQIEGGVAEADLLGIFGREGVFAATAWPLQGVTNGSTLVNYLVAAYDLYRSYDGKGSVVGDTAVYAQTSDVNDTSVYAFSHSGEATALDLVAVNKTSAAITTSIAIADAPALSTVARYELVNGAAKVTAVSGAAPAITCSNGACSIEVTLAAMSATTIVLR